MTKQIYAKEYEDYLITGKEESLNSLVSSSIEKEYFLLIRRLLKEDLTKELQKDINDFLQRIDSSKSYRLKALNIFKKLEKSFKKKEIIIEDIKELFSIRYVKTYNKPYKYTLKSETKKIDDEEELEKSEKYPSSLNLSDYVKTNKFIEDIYTEKIDPNDNEYKNIFKNDKCNLIFDFNKIPEKTLVKILVHNKDYKNIAVSVRNSISYAKIDRFKNVFKQVVNEVSKDEKLKNELTDFIFRRLNIFLNEQIKVLLEYKDLFNFDELFLELITRQSLNNNEDKKEKIQKLKAIQQMLKDYNYDKIKNSVLYSLLVLNSDLNIYDKDLFIEYIKYPLVPRSIYNLSDDIKEKIDKNKIEEIKCSAYLQIDDVEEQNIIEKYLKHFYLREKMAFEEFSKYFEEKYIKHFYAKMQFYLGNDEYTKNKMLEKYEINDLMKETKLIICEYNKESFNINEDVILNLEIKNIKTLYVNIYEINTENYYYTNKTKFDELTSLDGIVPTYEDIYSYNDKPQLLTEKKITISKLPKKRGLYVIEFIGNGHASRAIIQKGNLRCIHKNTINGVVLYILDEENKICKGEQTGIWVNNEWFPSILETGAILIPYSVNGSVFILKHNDFCCLETNITIPNEEYEFDGLFIVNKESFLFGNLTKILVRPYLFVCNELCPLEELNNVKLTIKTIKTENNQEIPSERVIDNIKLSYNKEYSFDFQVPPKLKSINFELSAEIKQKTNDETKLLKFNKSYNFNRRYEYDSLIKQNENGNYIIHLLGKNGEPKKNHEVNVYLDHKYQSIINKPILMETDNEGKIDLGKLENIKKIKIENNKFHIEQNPKYVYKQTITILENQEINLPFYGNKTIHLTKINNIMTILENLSDLLKIQVTDEKNQLYNLTIPKLPKGDYKLHLDSEVYQINVIKGKVMDIKDFIICDDGTIICNSNVENPIALENVSYKNNELKIKLNKNNKSTTKPRIHINCLQYLPKNFNINLLNYYDTSFYKYIIANEVKSFVMNKNENIYLNNKILSDEMQYILDRKQYEINLGNSLEKPSLLLKPQYIRDATTEIKEGVEGVEFFNEESSKRKYLKCGGKRSFEDFDYDDDNFTVHDFINVSPYIEENLIPDENGEIIIKKNFSEFSFLHIICFDNISCSEDYFYLNNGKTSLRDLRAVNELEFDKNYCEFRKIYPLSKKDKHHLKDITSIKYKIFDSLENYVEFIKIINPSLENDIKQFEFLLNFDNLKLPEKLEKMSKYFSHELNIYLYFHHNQFFNEYIYPILKYKSEKTFIDYFLLNDKQKISEYVKRQKIEGLNTFEKCLLIYSIRETNRELASRLSRKIRSECPREDYKEIKKLFNTALNLKPVKEEEKIERKMEKCERKMDRLSDSDEEVFHSIKYKKKRKMREKLEDDEDDEDEDFACGERGNFLYSKNEAKKIIAKTQLFKEEGKSKEFCETQYYNKVYKDTNVFINPTHFFADLAQFWCQNVDTLRNVGFKTDNILTKPNNLTEFIFMLAVLDLEEKSSSNNQTFIKDKGLGLTIEANSNIYLLTKEINETQLNSDNQYSLILAQMVFEADKVEDKNENEPTKFLTNRSYLLRTIVTNISPERINCEILMQIPEGSIPVDSDEYKIIETANINSYQSQFFEQKFYFPEEGTFKLYPSSASINNLVIAKGGIKTFEVVSNIKLSKEEITNIEDVLNQGNKKEILEYIKKCEVIRENDLEKIYWMLKDKEFYSQLINILKDKYIYDKNVWEYSSNFEDIDSLQEYLFDKRDKKILKCIGNEIDYKYLKIDKTNNAHILNHLDYYPILNNRAFRLPKSKSILNAQLRDTYENYISYLITLPKINDYEYMRLCYYLILQQRIKEALIIFNKIDKKNIIGNNLNSLELQYDYLTAYLDFCNGYPKFEKAREICKKYKNIAILSWRNMFNEIGDQLNEYDGKVDYENEINNEKDKLKTESEEFINIEIKNQDINVIYRNISNITIKYYLIDIEILFSRSPFVKKSKVDFGFIKPHIINNIKVNKEPNENIHSVAIPKELKDKNFFIEVSSGKKIENDLYYSSSLKYSIFESIGEIKVMTPEQKALPEVYVKCFCETNNEEIKFYKDGFTDLRGKFDYVSLNNDLINIVKKFSILLVSKDYGSVIVSCNPPKIIQENNGNNLFEQMLNYRQNVKNKLRK